MKNITYSFLLFCLSSLVLGFSACDDDDDGNNGGQMPPIYDAAAHIYGTIFINNSQEWEVLIDPVSGSVDTLPGTFISTGAFTLPLGARSLHTFDPDQRIYLSRNTRMTVQDLESLVARSIELTDPATNLSTINPQYLTQGISDNIVLLLDTDGAIWRIDTEAATAEMLLSDLNLEQNEIAYFFQNSNGTQLYCFTKIRSGNDPTSNHLYVYDLGSDAVVEELELPPSFGFVEDPSTGAFYYLTVPTDSTGIRLRIIQPLDNGTLHADVSQEDLDIDNLAFYQQTIHSATNSYLALSTNAQLDNPQNKLYRINRSTGLLEGEADLELSGIILKVAGE